VTLLEIIELSALASGTLVALIGYVKDRAKNRASTSSLAVDAAGDAVATVLLVFETVRAELDAARDEIAHLRIKISELERRLSGHE